MELSKILPPLKRGKPVQKFVCTQCGATMYRYEKPDEYSGLRCRNCGMDLRKYPGRVR